jgi:hypothetical protein
MAQHWANKKEAKAHKITGNTENGACLWGHNGRFAKSSCAYRYQGHEISKAEREGIYNNWPLPKRTTITTLAYRTTKKKLYPPGYPQELSIPRKGDWFLEGPTDTGYKVGKKTVPKGANFSKDQWPYWHNSHHLIPKGMFLAEINARAAAPVVRLTLLKAMYNINHKINVGILPQDAEVAKMLALPRHLILGKSSKLTTLAEEYFNHTEYNDAVKDRLDEILDDFSKLCDKAPPEHDDPEVTLTKDKLEKLSKDCWRKCVSFAGAGDGEPISAIKRIPSYRG